MNFRVLSALVLCAAFAARATACELCAIYGASNARGEASGGFLFTVAEQFIPFRTVQSFGEEVTLRFPGYLDRSITHFVPTYNVSPRFGVSLSVPLNHRSFLRTDFRYFTDMPRVLESERGVETDLGDVALIGRVTVVQKIEMDYSVVVNLLGGVKFPTGDTARIEDEVEQTRIYDALLPPNTPHDPLAHTEGGIHQHDLSPGSGSFDGVFGVTLNSRWRRWFFNSQVQYYLRTEALDFEYGDELIVTGGPGAYVLLKDSFTLSLQANATYDHLARDEILGRESNRTGWTAWYFGPLLALTIGEHFSLNAGVDIPLSIANHEAQNVPDYVIHAGLTWRF